MQTPEEAATQFFQLVSLFTDADGHLPERPFDEELKEFPTLPIRRAELERDVSRYSSYLRDPPMIVNDCFWTPLHVAARWAQHEAIQTAAEHGFP